MTTHLTLGHLTSTLIKFIPEYQQAENKDDIYPVIKHRMLTRIFNGSTAALVASVALAIIGSFAASVVVGASALFLRNLSENELFHYTMPNEDEDGDGIIDVKDWNRIHLRLNNETQLLEVADKEERVGLLFERLGRHKPDNWEENKLVLNDYALWKNLVPLNAPKVDEAPSAYA